MAAESKLGQMERAAHIGRVDLGMPIRASAPAHTSRKPKQENIP
jgi:hypothetical protein